MKNKVKLIALDLDSTILYNGEFANPNDLVELQRLHDEGYLITLSTGQSYKSASRHAKNIGIDKYINKIVCQNGAYFTSVDQFNPEEVDLISPKIMGELIEYFNEKNINAYILKYNDFEKIYYVNLADKKALNNLTDRYEFIDLNETKTSLDNFSFIWFAVSLEQEEVILGELSAKYADELSLVSSFEDDQSKAEIMISHKTANKGDKLVSLAKQFNISPDEILAFGDGGNDVPMFKKVKYSVAMGNAKQSVKDSAVYVTDDCLNSGVANFLKTHF